MNALTVTGLFMWSVAVGLRDGYTWTAFRDRLPFNYHLMRRYIEQGGLCVVFFGLGGFEGLLLAVGLMWAFTFLVYEPCLDYMITGRWVWFKKSNPYEGRNVGRWEQIALTITGMVLAVVGWLW